MLADWSVLWAFLLVFLFILLSCGGRTYLGHESENTDECLPENTCGDACCEFDQQCRDGVCISCERELCHGQCCPTEQFCSNSGCCALESMCDTECCPPGTLCELGICATDCGDGQPECLIGGCCPQPQVCYLDVCTDPGNECDDPFDCPEGWYCDFGIDRCLPLGPPPGCTLPSPTLPFEPQISWQWPDDVPGAPSVLPEYDQVMMQPVVANLNDDNGDGSINEHDIPDIVFTTFQPFGTIFDSYRGRSYIRAISGDGQRELFTITDHPVWAGSGLVIADIDSDGSPEILACGWGGIDDDAYGPLIAFSHRGEPEWFSHDDRIICHRDTAPAVGDIDGDGYAEILVQYTVIDHDGDVRWSHTSDLRRNPMTVFADTDLDSNLEVVGGNVVYDSDGEALWGPDERDGIFDGFPAIGNLDLDDEGFPEAVVVSGKGARPSGCESCECWGHHIYVRHLDTGEILWGPFDINPTDDPYIADRIGSTPCGGGPPTIADFDGDGHPEIGTAGAFAYVVFEGESGERRWYFPTEDDSSRQTGSSVFDFDGDGRAEVIYNDEHYLRIFDGNNGDVLFERCNTSGTLWEYPLIVDVDNDAHSELIVASNNYWITDCKTTDGGTGIRVFEDVFDNWVRTRRIWNQHAYSVTNINEDGTVPTNPLNNWQISGFNHFRQNTQFIGLHNAPDLIVGEARAMMGTCPDWLQLTARITNNGRASVGPGAELHFFGRQRPFDYEFLTSIETRRRLFPGESEVVLFSFNFPRESLDQIFDFFVTIEPPSADFEIEECNEENNHSFIFSGTCTS